MKRLILFLIPVVLLSCKKKAADEPAVLDFTYTRIAPLMVEFTNRSAGFDGYTWDFGDGTYSYAEKIADHGYEDNGTYIVTLTGDRDGETQEKRQEITLSEPTVYIAGYTLYHIPYENKYYRLIFKDDNLLPSAWDWQTIYTPLLDNSKLPYTYFLNNPVKLENLNSHTYYTVQVVRTNTTNGGTEISCMKQQLKVKDIKRYLEEYILQTETGNTAIGIYLYYEY